MVQEFESVEDFWSYLEDEVFELEFKMKATKRQGDKKDFALQAICYAKACEVIQASGFGKTRVQIPIFPFEAENLREPFPGSHLVYVEGPDRSGARYLEAVLEYAMGGQAVVHLEAKEPYVEWTPGERTGGE